MLDIDTVRRAPKVALHDHLDGGLRPETVLELAAEIGHELPAGSADALGDWFFEAADSGTLVRYLQTFDHTVAVMQTAEALHRVAREFVEDQAADGVVYAEARWAPAQHTARGLSMREAVAAVGDGLTEGVRAVEASGGSFIAQQLVTGLRHHPDVSEIAELAVTCGDDLVAGFDLAGPEDGFPPTQHAAAFDALRRANARYTVHAGEAAGLDSIWEAYQRCGAQRLGHGARLVEDITEKSGELRLGSLAQLICDLQIPLELCPSSNLQTGISESIGAHPFGMLERAGMRVTVNCDNRLMSRTTLSREFALLSEAFGYDIADIQRFTINAAESAFLPLAARRALIEGVIIPEFTELGAAAS